MEEVQVLRDQIDKMQLVALVVVVVVVVADESSHNNSSNNNKPPLKAFSSSFAPPLLSEIERYKRRDLDEWRGK